MESLVNLLDLLFVTGVAPDANKAFPFLFYLVVMVLVSILTHLMTPKPKAQDAKPNALGDFRFPTAQEGRAVPIPFGTTKIAGPNVLWYGNYGYQGIRTRVDGAPNYTGEYAYYFGMQIGLCRGPLDGISRISLGEDQVLVQEGQAYISGVGIDDGYDFDINEVAIEYTQSPNDFMDGRFRFYAGTETQNPNAYLGTVVGQTTVRSANCQFGIEEETAGNYWVRNTATKDKFGANVTLAAALECEVGNTLIIGEVQRIVAGAIVTPGVAYSGLDGEILEIDGSGDLRVDPTSSIASQVDSDGGIVYEAQGTPEGWASPLVAGMDINPAYKGLAYLVWSNDTGTGPGKWGTSSSIDPIECVVHRYPRPTAVLSPVGDFSVIAPDAYGRGDANPVYCLYELLTDTLWGAGVPEGDLDADSFREAAEVVYNEGLGFSMLIDSEQTGADVSDVILEHIDGILAQNENGSLRLRLNRPPTQETIDAAPVFDFSNIVDFKGYTRQTWGETSNAVHVKFIDRLREWRDSSAHSFNSANLAIVGREQDVDVTMPGVRTADVAGKIADRELLFVSSPAAQVNLKINGQNDGLFVGDLIKVTWPELELDEERFVITALDIGTASDNVREMTATSDRFQYVSTGTIYTPGPDVGALEIPADITPPPVIDLFAAGITPQLATFLDGPEIFDLPADPGTWSAGSPPTGYTEDPNNSGALLGRSQVAAQINVIALPNPEDNHPGFDNPPQTVLMGIDPAGGSAYQDKGEYQASASTVKSSYDQYWTTEQQSFPDESEVNWADPASSFNPVNVKLGLINDLAGGSWFSNYVSSGAGKTQNMFPDRKDFIVASLPAMEYSQEGMFSNYRGLAVIGDPASYCEYISIGRVDIVRKGETYPHGIVLGEYDQPGLSGTFVGDRTATEDMALIQNVTRGLLGTMPRGHLAGSYITLLDPVDTPMQVLRDPSLTFFPGNTAYTIAAKSKSKYGEEASYTQTDHINGSNPLVNPAYRAQAPAFIRGIRTLQVGTESKRIKRAKQVWANQAKFGGDSYQSNNADLSTTILPDEDAYTVFNDQVNAQAPIAYRYQTRFFDSTDFCTIASWTNNSSTDPILHQAMNPGLPGDGVGCDYRMNLRWYLYKNPTAGVAYSGTLTGADFVAQGADTWWVNGETGVEYGDSTFKQPNLQLSAGYNGLTFVHSAGTGTPRGPTQASLSRDGFLNSEFGGSVPGVSDQVTINLPGHGSFTGYFAILNFYALFEDYTGGSRAAFVNIPYFFRV